MEIQDYYTEINFLELPSKGIFYDNIKIFARGATAFELDKFEAGDFSSYYTVHQEIYMLLCSCLLVQKNNIKGNVNLISDIDKYYLLIKIKELTEDQRPVLIMSTSNQMVSIELKCENLEFWSPSESLMSFYDEDLKCFKTTTPFEYYFITPTIGVNSCYLEWVRNKVMGKKEIDKEFLAIGPCLSKSNNFISVDEINHLNELYNELEPTEYMMVKWFSDQIISSFGIRRLKYEIDDMTYYANIDLFRSTTRIFNKIN